MAKAKYKEKEKEEDPKRPTPVTRDGPYVMMLLITFVAIVAGCVFLYLDYDEYGKQSPPKEGTLQIQPLGGKAEGTGTSGPAPGTPGKAP